MSSSKNRREASADTPTEGPQDGIEVALPPPAAALAERGTYIALDRLEGRAEPGAILMLDDDDAAVYLAMGRVAAVDVTTPRAPALVSLEDEA
jgi:hypothetical protein